MDFKMHCFALFGFIHLNFISKLFHRYLSIMCVHQNLLNMENLWIRTLLFFLFIFIIIIFLSGVVKTFYSEPRLKIRRHPSDPYEKPYHPVLIITPRPICPRSPPKPFVVEQGKGIYLFLLCRFISSHVSLSNVQNRGKPLICMCGLENKRGLKRKKGQSMLYHFFFYFQSDTAN